MCHWISLPLGREDGRIDGCCYLLVTLVSDDFARGGSLTIRPWMIDGHTARCLLLLISRRVLVDGNSCGWSRTARTCATLSRGTSLAEAGIKADMFKLGEGAVVNAVPGSRCSSSYTSHHITSRYRELHNEIIVPNASSSQASVSAPSRCLH